jgi:hypothetical protein
MSYFLKSGNTFRVSSKEAMDLHEKLPAGNYVIKQDPMGNLYLESIENFEIKGKRYGDLTSNCDRILNTFNSRSASTGVMLAGEKGSGKSLLAKAISLAGMEQAIPTIVINAPWTGDKFNSFIQSIEQPTIILFDEFEKVYPSEEQEHILTLLDGVFPSKKLFILTCNDKWRVDTHMRNRPGRIFYMLDFKGLTQDFIIEYCNDNLNNKDHIKKICNIASLFSEFNFDMLKALVEEMNRYNETPEDALRMLNAKPEFDNGNRYSVALEVAGQEIDPKLIQSSQWHGNPLNGQIAIDFKTLATPSARVVEDGEAIAVWDDDDDYNWDEARFVPSDLKKVEPATGSFMFFNAEGQKVTLTKIVEKNAYYYDAF